MPHAADPGAPPVKVGIVGLGLIGGSLARDLAAAGHSVVAYDRSRASLKAARRSRVIAGVAGADLQDFSDCDAVVLAVPVTAVPAILRRARTALADVPLITDVGSTKASIARVVRSLGLAPKFVGAHPLAGDTQAGWGASRRGLFSGRRVYLTPDAAVAPRAMARARALWRATGARIAIIGAAEHDTLLAATSHLPQVSSTALAMLLGDRRIPRAALGRGGRDATRLARSSPEIWAAILTDNRRNVVPTIARYRKALEMIERAVARGDAEGLQRLFSRTNRWASTGRR